MFGISDLISRFESIKMSFTALDLLKYLNTRIE